MKGKSKIFTIMTDKFIWLGIGLSAIYWILESVIDVFVFHHGNFFEQVYPAPHEIWMRLLFVGLIIIFGAYVRFSFNKRKRAEETLRVSEERLKLITDGLPMLIAYVDKDQQYRFVNKQYEKWFGLSSSEIVGQKVIDILGEAGYGKVQDGIKAVLSGKFVSYENEFPFENGSSRPYHAQYIPHVTEDEQITGYFLMVEDISDRKQMEKKFQESARLNELLLDSLPHPAMLIRRERIVLAANRIAREVGTKIGEYCWRSFGRSEYIPDEHKRYLADHKGDIPPGGTKCTHCLADETLESNKPTHREVKAFGQLWDTWWVPTENDVYLHYAINITERKEAEEALRKVHDQMEQLVEERTAELVEANEQLKHEIEERKEAEKQKETLQTQLQQAQKMEAIGTLAGGIAHDFNNILSFIFGYTELARLDVPEGSKVEQDLKEVLNAGHRAKDMVKQILAFSRQGEQERKPVQIGPIVKEALKLLRASLPTTIEIRQDIEIPPGRGRETVEADPTQIHQVLMNLCTNAAHAMRNEGGILEVSLANVELDSDFNAQYPDLNSGPYLRLTVTDTGHGMTPEVLERIFDPYFTTKEKGEGTGLGLSVVHGIVKSHGGMIMAYSEPAKGTTFHVYLPRIEREVTAEPEAAEVFPRGQERILFIDDEPNLADIGKRMLEHLGYEVVTRTSSIEALELFKSQPNRFDLVITDVTMPHMTGEKLARDVMEIRPDIPVILCTGYSDRIIEEKAKALGVSAFAMKPIVRGDLAKTIRRVLDKAIDD